jgi:hypothetical protein
MLPFVALAQQIGGTDPSGQEFSQSTGHHVLAAAHGVPDVVLVSLGAIVLLMTTIYTVWYLVHPGEAGDAHIKRRILGDGREESR